VSGKRHVSREAAGVARGVLRRLLSFFAIGLALGGCAHQVQLENLQPPAANDPRRNLVFDLRNGQVNTSYRPWQGDLLVVKVASTGVEGCDDREAKSQAIASADLVVVRNGSQESLALTDRAISELVLSTAAPSQKLPYIQIATKARSAIRMDLRPFDGSMTWGEYRATLDATCRKYGVMLDVVPVEQAFAHPGDEIVVTRQSLVSDPSGTGTRDVERFELTVDSGGAIYLPSVTRLALFEIYASGGGKLIAPRAYTNALLAPADSRLVVTRRALAVLAACLSIAEVASNEKDCAGLDARYAPADGDGGARREVRYTIEPGRRTWSLVDQQGRRITLPFRYGVTVLDAVRAAYRSWSGQELPGAGSAYLTVVPREGSGGPPFFAAIGASDGMDRLLLTAGDTVHLTPWMPRRANAEGSVK